jgi:hypothetical protein
LRYSALTLATLLVACNPGAGSNDPAHECGPAVGGEGEVLGPIPAGTLLSVGAPLDFSAGVVDALPFAQGGSSHLNAMLATGDAALRKLGDQAVVINRGHSNNLLVVTGGIGPGRQISLGDTPCGPHDVELLDGCRALVTCYDATKLKIVHLDSGLVEDGPDLAAFADADGLPEMDQLAVADGKVFVSLELLDRTSWYAPTGPGLVVVLDATTLEVVDTDSTTAGVQGLGVCTDPYTDFAPGPDGHLYLGCYGTYGVADSAGVVAIDPTTLAVTTIADGPKVGGTISYLRVGADGTPYAVIYWPYSTAQIVATEMRLIRLDPTEAVTLHSVAITSDPPVYSPLSGLAIGPDGTLYVGNRTAGADAGVWAVSPAGLLGAHQVTTLPPVELETF